ncbi:hypothetical protein B0H13DRAFT_1644377, partial [Mycena leptocephala]
DYTLCRSLSEASKLRFIKVTYDIWCQYHVNLEPRVEELFNNMLLILRRIRGAIPKMHIHNHQDLCEILWNLNWLPNCGLAVGEMIETGWAEQNLTAGSTKEQNDGHRHDSIDDTSGHWNWDKLIRLSKCRPSSRVVAYLPWSQAVLWCGFIACVHRSSYAGSWTLRVAARSAGQSWGLFGNK